MAKSNFFAKKSAKNFCVLEKKCTFAASKKRGVAQLVVYLVWDQVVARSSRVTPTKKTL
jgi:hypothetical protein